MNPAKSLAHAFSRAVLRQRINYEGNAYAYGVPAALMAGLGYQGWMPEAPLGLKVVSAASIFAAAAAHRWLAHGPKGGETPAGRAFILGAYYPFDGSSDGGERAGQEDLLIAGGPNSAKDIATVAKVYKYILHATAPYDREGDLPPRVHKRVLAAAHMAEDAISRLRVYRHKYNDDIPHIENLYEHASERIAELPFTRKVIDSKGGAARLTIAKFAADTQTPTPEMPALTRRVRVERAGDEKVDAHLEIEAMLEEQGPAPLAARKAAR